MHARTIADRTGAFKEYFIELRDTLVNQPDINRGEWQSQHGDIIMKELLHVAFEWPMPGTIASLESETGARIPWAEDHFLERVSGEPLNPAPSEAWWPFRQKKEGDTNTDHKSEGNAFSHTYPERMWPKTANGGGHTHAAVHNGEFLGYETIHHQGIRFEYGDLGDVVNQLHKSPMTRQAYLPIWFPEDTGAVHRKRVPCTLGYHFIIQEARLDISYFMRSTDLLRHFQDDVYLAVRLAQWVVEEFNRRSIEAASREYEQTGAFTYREDYDKLHLGNLVFHTANMHIFKGDVDIINFWKSQGKVWF